MSLLKLKKSDRSTAPLVPPWHPNFRNFEHLPDVKVVRTSFFINAVSIVIALGLIGYLSLQEYKVHEFTGQIDDLQHQIDANKKASDQAVQLFQKFKAEEAKAAEVKAFIKTNLVPSDFILDLAQTLPANFVLNYIDMHENGVTLHGIIQGTPDEASGEASAYLDRLRSDPNIGPKFENIALTGLNRGGGGQGTQDKELSFEISLTAKRGPKS